MRIWYLANQNIIASVGGNHSTYFWPFLDGLKIVWKIVKRMIKMVWLCEFWSGINSWDLKILYRNLETRKKKLIEKIGMEWNGLEDWKKWKKIE